VMVSLMPALADEAFFFRHNRKNPQVLSSLTR
jgi:hypothetical protein